MAEVLKPFTMIAYVVFILYGTVVFYKLLIYFFNDLFSFPWFCPSLLICSIIPNVCMHETQMKTHHLKYSFPHIESLPPLPLQKNSNIRNTGILFLHFCSIKQCGSIFSRIWIRNLNLPTVYRGRYRDGKKGAMAPPPGQGFPIKSHISAPARAYILAVFLVKFCKCWQVNHFCRTSSLRDTPKPPPLMNFLPNLH